MLSSVLRVFICSSFGDLSAERLAVIEVIEKMQLAHEAMEFFGAREHKAIDTCLSEVRRCNLLVVLVGHRYGSLVPGAAVSFSEAEYNEAISLGKPCLVYMRSPDTPILIKDVERDPQKIALLERWKEQLQTSHTVAMFTDSKDLADRVWRDLTRTVHLLAPTSKGESRTPPAAADDVFASVSAALTAGVRPADIILAIHKLTQPSRPAGQAANPSAMLSYSGVNGARARELAGLLRHQGIDVWIDVENVANASAWTAQLDSALERTDCFIFLLSAAYLASPWAQQELEHILARRLSHPLPTTLVPILLENVEPPPLLRTYRFLDFTKAVGDREILQLAATIRASAARKQGQSVPAHRDA